MARPSSFTQEIADAICERLIEGESLRAICASEDMPSKATVCRWLAAHEQFRDQYARAREAQADTLFEQILEIADDEAHDWTMTKKGVITNEVAIGRARLQVDARKWMAGKLQPKKYGDKIAVGGSDDLPPVKTDNVWRLELVSAKPHSA